MRLIAVYLFGLTAAYVVALIAAQHLHAQLAHAHGLFVP